MVPRHTHPMGLTPHRTVSPALGHPGSSARRSRSSPHLASRSCGNQTSASHRTKTCSTLPLTLDLHCSMRCSNDLRPTFYAGLLAGHCARPPDDPDGRGASQSHPIHHPRHGLLPREATGLKSSGHGRWRHSLPSYAPAQSDHPPQWAASCRSATASPCRAAPSPITFSSAVLRR